MHCFFIKESGWSCRQSYEAAALYHNQTFDTTQLSHEFLFARFAWVIIEKAKSVVTAGLRKRFRLIVSTSETPVNEPQVGSAQGSVGTNQKGKKRKVQDATSFDFQVSEDQELEEDLRLAERVAPFFCKFLVSSVVRQLTLSSKLKNPTCEGTGTIL